MPNAIIRYIAAHKIAAAGVVFTIIGGGIFAYAKASGAKAETRYILAAAEKSTVVKSVSGSGQISASNQIDLKPGASGKLVGVYVAKGQKVKAGQLLAQIDATDALRSLRDAETSLKNAQLSMDKLQTPPSDIDRMQAESSVIDAKQAETTAVEDLARAYEDGFNAVSEAFLDLPDIMKNLDSVLYASDVSSNQWNVDAYADAARRYETTSTDLYRDGATKAYASGREAYEATFDAYKLVNRNSDEAAIERLINETYATVKKVADAAKAETDLIQFYQDQLTSHQIPLSPYAKTHLSTLALASASLNSHASSMLNNRRSIQKDKTAISDATRAINVKQAALDELNAGADEIDLASQELTLEQRREAVSNARVKLGDYSVRAPFDGVIAALSVTRGETVTTGTAIATIITEQQIAEITLNEVDIAKVKTGQKATLTFDSLEDFSLTGTVADVDALGTVSQGVVTYGVKITLDTQDERIKPSMSVTAAIVTEAKTSALVVSSSAVKTANGMTYVETIDEIDSVQAVSSAGVTSKTPPRRIEVEIGIESDTQTEIVSGLSEGDLVVIRTVTTSSQTSATSQNRNILQAAGGSGGPSGSTFRTGGGNTMFIDR